MAGYTRQDTTGQIANNEVIDADDLNAEFNAVQTAFSGSSGHNHDPSSSNSGAPIEKVGPAGQVTVNSTQVLPNGDNTALTSCLSCRPLASLSRWNIFICSVSPPPPGHSVSVSLYVDRSLRAIRGNQSVSTTGTSSRERPPGSCPSLSRNRRPPEPPLLRWQRASSS